ncbi:hypothetical protein [Clostridium minihomine]|uniref:hypothetical protein n=1 Tax=Clostridium minihomine TaxID=2045012 RepID=UPI000C761C01|nr:hypothetical protein [Clostridium minihomine]
MKAWESKQQDREYKGAVPIYFSDVLKWVKEVYYDNQTVQKVCNRILIIIAAVSIAGFFTFAFTLGQNCEKVRLASTHYNCWFEQLPPEHPLKQDPYGFQQAIQLPSELGIVAGVIFDTQEEIVKYEFSKLDITELGVLDAYLNQKFDESKPEYLLIDAKTTKTLSNIKLKNGETKLIQLYRNGEELSFDYIPPENMWRYHKNLELHELISMGFVKAYVQNPDIAKITNNQITAVTKGKTKLVLIYGTQLLECDIIVR